MKRILLTLMLLLFLVGSALAFEPCVSSNEQTTTRLIYTVVPGTLCYLVAVKVITDGTNVAKVIIDDSTDGSGSVKDETSVVGGDHWGGRTWPYPTPITTGIYVTVSGTGASYIIEYILR